MRSPAGWQAAPPAGRRSPEHESPEPAGVGHRSKGVRTRALVALSGGVDSAVAAALLIEQGYEVVAAMLQLWADRGPGGFEAAPDALTHAVPRARRVADWLGVPFHVVDARAIFRRRVVDYFVAEYGVGRTPSPCVLCNRAVRFGTLLDLARDLDAAFVATGHFARVRQAGARYQLLRGCDSTKDQSYFLHTLSQDQLARVRFPLGRLTKAEVRAIASQRGLPVASQPDSQDICFLAGSDYRRFLASQAPHLFQPGPIRDRSGHVLGQHRGLPAYTVGQRKGLGIAAPEPLYVLAIEPAENALVVGTADELGQDECLVERLHYVSGEAAVVPFRAVVQIRYRACPVEATVTPLEGRVAHVRFASPQPGVTPGQFLVVYDGEVVLGGGVICRAQKSML